MAAFAAAGRPSGRAGAARRPTRRIDFPDHRTNTQERWSHSDAGTVHEGAVCPVHGDLADDDDTEPDALLRRGGGPELQFHLQLPALPRVDAARGGRAARAAALSTLPPLSEAWCCRKSLRALGSTPHCVAVRPASKAPARRHSPGRQHRPPLIPLTARALSDFKFLPLSFDAKGLEDLRPFFDDLPVRMLLLARRRPASARDLQRIRARGGRGVGGREKAPALQGGTAWPGPQAATACQLPVGVGRRRNVAQSAHGLT